MDHPHYDLPEAITPYPEQDGAATSGWSGSEASQERAVSNDRSGRTKKLQNIVLQYVESGGVVGRTIADVRKALPDHHHGTLSGALSALHKAGKVARLTEKRNRCSVYVIPSKVGTREVSQVGCRRKVNQFREGWDAATFEAWAQGYLSDAQVEKMLQIVPSRG